eukprot:scaffold3661_cov403-Prasinococcus_capsulatus_cf.AAC.3
MPSHNKRPCAGAVQGLLRVNGVDDPLNGPNCDADGNEASNARNYGTSHLRVSRDPSLDCGALGQGTTMALRQLTGVSSCMKDEYASAEAVGTVANMNLKAGISSSKNARHVSCV